jgi:hypothetical protein
MPLVFEVQLAEIVVGARFVGHKAKAFFRRETFDSSSHLASTCTYWDDEYAGLLSHGWVAAWSATNSDNSSWSLGMGLTSSR